MPWWTVSMLRTRGLGVRATIGTAGRKRDRFLAVPPEAVGVRMAEAPTASTRWTVDRATESAMPSPGLSASLADRSGGVANSLSTAVTMEAMVRITCAGSRPMAVSPDSMMQSVPSITALATSLASARDGRGL